MGYPMDPNTGETEALIKNYTDLAVRIDHTLVAPDLTSEQIAAGCKLAVALGVACVTVRPGDIEMAVRMINGSQVAAGAVVGFPHGSSTTAAKLYELRDMMRRGAREIDVVANTGRLLDRQFQHVDTEFQQLADACEEYGATLKVILETGYLADDLKIVAGRIATRARVHCLVAASGFGPRDASLDDVRLLRQHTNPEVSIKAIGGISTLAQAIAFCEAGCARVGTTASDSILNEWKGILAARKQAGEKQPS